MNPAASLILLPFSAIYGAVTRARLAAYRRGLFAVSKLAAPVISVGNITAGGTGKTPLAEWVSRTIVAVAHQQLHETRRVCLLTRGYGKSDPKTQVVVSNGKELGASEREGGDEPFLLATNLLGVAAVISNPDRFAAGLWAIENLGSEAFVLDDGFQHLQLFRDLDIVAIDATNPWGNGLLPRGRLREPPEGLSRADCVVITRTEQIADSVSIKTAIQRLAGNVPILLSRMVTSGLRTIAGEPIDASTLLGKPMGAFCGVGNPASFFKHLRHDGFKLEFTRAFPDHHRYQQSDLDALVRDSENRGARGLLTTAKDATKLQSFNFGTQCYVLDIRVSIADEDSLIDLIRQTLSKSQ